MADYAAATNVNIIGAKIQDIILYKFGKQDKLSIMPQFIELNIYPSLFRSVLQADLVINDTISLHSNYPLVGEEIIEISYIPTDDDTSDSRAVDKFADSLQNLDASQIGTETTPKLTFIVTDVAQIYPDDKTRSSFYSIKLYSQEYLENQKTSVMKAYRKGYHENIPQILTEHLKCDPKKINKANFEESKGIVTTVVPNMQPFPAIMWMAARAVPSNPKHFNYMFYEDLLGYKFQTLQKLFEDGKKQTAKSKKSFIYFSNALKDQSLSTAEQKSISQSTVTAIAFKKRYSTQEKVVAGFYENEYLEIDILNMRVNSTVTEAKDVPENTIAKAQINTPEFIKAAKSVSPGVGDRTRVRYVIGHGGGDQPSQENFWKDKFGEAARAFSALSQVQIQITTPGDTRVVPGQVVNLEVPEFHGFNDTKVDPYVAGDYIITDMKHTISVGMRHVMVLNLARDSYEKTIEKKHTYNLNV